MDYPLLILIVDDDEDDIDLFKEVVEDLFPKTACHSARNGEEALKMLKNADDFPDIIFMDLNMPRMDGKTCLKKLKEHDQLNKIPVVIYTTSSSLNHKTETRKLGATHFITKPTSYTRLCEVIEEAVKKVILEKRK